MTWIDDAAMQIVTDMVAFCDDRNFATNQGSKQQIAKSMAEIIRTHLDQFEPILPGAYENLIVICKQQDATREAMEKDIRYVVSQQWDDICWLDAYKNLAKHVGLEFDPLLLPDELMLANCQKFIASMRSGSQYPPCYVTTLVEQQAREIEVLKAHIRDLEKKSAAPIDAAE